MHISRLQRRIAMMGLMLMLAGGCGGEKSDMVPIRGEVLLEGKPVSQGQVVYLPKNPQTGRQANGPIKPDGTFEMTTQAGGDGVKYGEYDIVVFGYGTDPTNNATSREAYEKAKKSEQKSVIPTRYASRGASGLSDRVDADHPGTKRIELTK